MSPSLEGDKVSLSNEDEEDAAAACSSIWGTTEDTKAAAAAADDDEDDAASSMEGTPATSSSVRRSTVAAVAVLPPRARATEDEGDERERRRRKDMSDRAAAVAEVAVALLLSPLLLKATEDSVFKQACREETALASQERKKTGLVVAVVALSVEAAPPQHALWRRILVRTTRQTRGNEEEAVEEDREVIALVSSAVVVLLVSTLKVSLTSTSEGSDDNREEIAFRNVEGSLLDFLSLKRWRELRKSSAASVMAVAAHPSMMARDEDHSFSSGASPLSSSSNPTAFAIDGTVKSENVAVLLLWALTAATTLSIKLDSDSLSLWQCAKVRSTGRCLANEAAERPLSHAERAKAGLTEGGRTRAAVALASPFLSVFLLLSLSFLLDFLEGVGAVMASAPLPPLALVTGEGAKRDLASSDSFFLPSSSALTEAEIAEFFSSPLVFLPLALVLALSPTVAGIVGAADDAPVRSLRSAEKSANAVKGAVLVASAPLSPSRLLIASSKSITFDIDIRIGCNRESLNACLSGLDKWCRTAEVAVRRNCPAAGVGRTRYKRSSVCCARTLRVVCDGREAEAAPV
jgi:hypothetical protein